MTSKPFRLVLTAEQSAALADNGPRFSIAIIHPGSWPDSPGRMILDLIETDVATANGIVAILKGEARVVRIKQQATATDAAAANVAPPEGMSQP